MIYYLLVIIFQQLIKLKIAKFQNSFLISKDPPRKAKGIEPIINGKSNLKLLLQLLHN